MLYTLAWILIVYVCYSLCDGDTASLVNSEKYSVARDRRFLLYDVNHGEGFNLRRDVYMRIANAVRLLREAGEPFILVLPPWSGLYHWKQPNVRLKWSEFFDVKNLDDFVPVLEFEDYLRGKSLSHKQIFDDSCIKMYNDEHDHQSKFVFPYTCFSYILIVFEYKCISARGT
uniref:GDP-fucose protein O-fucosyltransferase 2 n=1 Tax=Angiostrongylus cantonensis TaxID=6313 RepID=A0A0K0CUN3_ANGCA